MNKILLYFNTLKYLKLKQLSYRSFYKLRSSFRKGIYFRYQLTKESSAYEVMLKNSIINNNTFFKENTFVFLNKRHNFDKNIDWNYQKNGKLWTYNLTYFDFLCQQNIDKENGLILINSFIFQIEDIKDGLEPFPISLRGMNWIKFLVKYKIKEKKINNSLYAQYYILLDNLEYHLLGNHLLENGFSLLFGAYYFQDEKFYAKAKKILTHELEEQILDDGAHFELSPMYHQIMLFRVLDCINLIQNNDWKNQEMLHLFVSKAKIMFGWLNAITFENGSIPLLNDSANKIAPTTKQLNHYAVNLQLKHQPSNITPKLKESGYRKIKNKRYEMILDVGNIGPDYIPGHAHSDTFNFELYVDNEPVIVDTGLSTYETNDRRQVERSTKSHNTVEVDNEEQSEVWGGFRVARRAKIVELIETSGKIKATHDGYIKKRILHTREFITQEEQIIIIDSIDAKKQHSCVAYIHFYPNIDIQVNGKELLCKYLTLNSSSCIELIEYDYSPEFNTKTNAQSAKLLFNNKLEIKIRIKKETEIENY